MHHGAQIQPSQERIAPVVGLCDGSKAVPALLLDSPEAILFSVVMSKFASACKFVKRAQIRSSILCLCTHRGQICGLVQVAAWISLEINILSPSLLDELQALNILSCLLRVYLLLLFLPADIMPHIDVDHSDAGSCFCVQSQYGRCIL